jgi:heme exporter protein B
MRALWALLGKELRIELRTKEMLTSLLLLGLLTLLVLSFAFDPTSSVRPEAAPGALWVAVIFAGVLALGRSFLSERENDSLHGLLLCPVDRGTLYLGKAVANFVFMLMAQGFVLPVFVFFFNIILTTRFAAVIGVLALGLLGFSAIGTLFAAMSVRTRAREVMLPLLLLPMVVPLFIAGVRITQRLLTDKPLADVLPWVHLMVGFDLVFLVVGWLVFEYVVEE